MYEMYLNGHFYGAGPLEYMTELFKDYVETCGMYGRSSLNIEVRKRR